MTQAVAELSEIDFKKLVNESSHKDAKKLAQKSHRIFCKQKKFSDELQKTILTLRNDAKQLHKENDFLSKSRRTTSSKLRENHGCEIDAVKKLHVKEIEKLKQEYDIKIKSYQKTIDDLSKENESEEVSKLEATLKEFEEELNEKNETIRNLKKESKEFSRKKQKFKQHEATKEKLLKQNRDCQTKIESVKRECSDLRKQKQETELERLKLKQSFKKQNEKLKKEIRNNKDLRKRKEKIEFDVIHLEDEVRDIEKTEKENRLRQREKFNREQILLMQRHKTTIENVKADLNKQFKKQKVEFEKKLKENKMKLEKQKQSLTDKFEKEKREYKQKSNRKNGNKRGDNERSKTPAEASVMAVDLSRESDKIKSTREADFKSPTRKETSHLLKKSPFFELQMDVVPKRTFSETSSEDQILTSPLKTKRKVTIIKKVGSLKKKNKQKRGVVKLSELKGHEQWKRFNSESKNKTDSKSDSATKKTYAKVKRKRNSKSSKTRLSPKKKKRKLKRKADSSWVGKRASVEALDGVLNGQIRKLLVSENAVIIDYDDGKSEKLSADCPYLKLLTNEDKFYEVEGILKERRTRKGVQYLIRWKGYSAKHDQWVSDRGVTVQAVKEWKQRKSKGRR